MITEHAERAESSFFADLARSLADLLQTACTGRAVVPYRRQDDSWTVEVYEVCGYQVAVRLFLLSGGVSVHSVLHYSDSLYEYCSPTMVDDVVDSVLSDLAPIRR